MTKRKLNIEFHIRDIYHNQLRLCKLRGYNSPQYTLEELKVWCFNQPLYHQLHAAWVASGFIRALSPSIDRLNDYETYSLSNIQLMTSKENLDKSFKDTANGILNKRSKEVIQKTLTGEYITTYPSANLAGRSLGKTNGSSIVAVCLGHRNKAHGYIWEYV